MRETRDETESCFGVTDGPVKWPVKWLVGVPDLSLCVELRYPGPSSASGTVGPLDCCSLTMSELNALAKSMALGTPLQNSLSDAREPGESGELYLQGA